MPRVKLTVEEKNRRDANKLYERLMKREQRIKNQIEKQTKKIQDKIAKQEERIAKQIQKEEFKLANKARIEENKRKRELKKTSKYYGLVSTGNSLQRRINNEETRIAKKKASETMKEIRAIKAIENLQKRIAKEQERIAKLSQPKLPRAPKTFIGPLTKRQTNYRNKKLQNLANQIPLPSDLEPFVPEIPQEPRVRRQYNRPGQYPRGRYNLA